MTCYICKGEKMIALKTKRFHKKIIKYTEDQEMIVTIFGGIDACYFCAKAAELDYQNWKDGENYDRFI